MKKLLFCLFIPLLINAQSEYLAYIPIRGGFSELNVSPSEAIWIATRPGYTYYADKFNGLWHFGPFNPSLSTTGGGIFERATFFSDKIMMISGFIHGKQGNQNFVLRSDDGGISWNKVVFGESSWIDAFHSDETGKAWMSGSSQYIYYTEDTGKTWKQFDKVKPNTNLRFNSIHFNKDGNLGLFGSTDGKIYRTIDNCKNWELLPSPLSQGKLFRLTRERRADIEKIRMFGKYYIVNQMGKIYITETSQPDWLRMHDVIDFEVSENGNVYLINKDLSVELRDNDFNTVWKSKNRFETIPDAFSVKNNNLFACSSKKMYRINPNSFESAPMFTDEAYIEPNRVLKFEGDSIGFENSNVLLFNKDKRLWYRHMAVPFDIANAVVYKDSVLLSDYKLNNFTLDPKNKIIKPATLAKNLFSNKTIDTLSFIVGSRGCYHYNQAIRQYRISGENYLLIPVYENEGNLSKMQKALPGEKVKDLVQQAEMSRYKKVSYKDMEITEEDRADFKNIVAKAQKRAKKEKYPDWLQDGFKFPGENTDFDFYSNTADSLESIPETILSEVFLQPGMLWSTTTNWITIHVSFTDGTKLNITNMEYEPNYLYTPWTINYEGIVFQTGSIALSKAINKISNGKLIPKNLQDGKYAIFQITDYLYRKSVDDK